jgi:putative Ca2+/H+ antiporter (TMEM165/GDT1 family)
MFSISIPLVLSTFGIIFLAELPDKTAFSSMVLAAKYKAHQVFIGACLAMLVQTLVAVFAGSLLTLLPATPVRIIAGLGFLTFAFFAFRKRKDEEHLTAQEEKEEKAGKPAWIASFLVVFAAEWGDLSQLATAGLVAHQGNALSIGIGAVLGLWTVMLIATLIGSQLGRHLTHYRLSMMSSILFTIIGVYMLYSAVYPGA